jgi:hypothetical protein
VRRRKPKLLGVGRLLFCSVADGSGATRRAHELLGHILDARRRRNRK